MSRTTSLRGCSYLQYSMNDKANDKELVEFMDDALSKETKVYLAAAEAMLTMQVDADSKVKQRVLADERLLRRLQSLPVFVQGANRRPIGGRLNRLERTGLRETGVGVAEAQGSPGVTQELVTVLQCH